MAGKLTLSVDSLEVSSFETGEGESPGGTVKGHDVNALQIPQTVVLTTPCCGPSVTCPTAAAVACG
jgi:hypothetical protein